jgi:hypothetical protein
MSSILDVAIDVKRKKIMQGNCKTDLALFRDRPSRGGKKKPRVILMSSGNRILE